MANTFFHVIFSICFGCSKNHLIETVLLSTHIVCFCLEIKKLYFCYALLTKGLKEHIFPSFIVSVFLWQSFQCRQIKMFFGDVNISVNGNHNILKFTKDLLGFNQASLFQIQGLFKDYVFKHYKLMASHQAYTGCYDRPISKDRNPL